MLVIDLMQVSIRMKKQEKMITIPFIEIFILLNNELGVLFLVPLFQIVQMI